MKPHSCRVVKLTESGRKVRNRTQLCDVSTSDRPRAASMAVPRYLLLHIRFRHIQKCLTET